MILNNETIFNWVLAGFLCLHKHLFDNERILCRRSDCKFLNIAHLEFQRQKSGVWHNAG